MGENVQRRKDSNLKYKAYWYSAIRRPGKFHVDVIQCLMY